jgi:energy-coupling factor transport system substrate-specific component
MTMLLPRSMPEAVAAVAYSVVCALRGFLYGILYAPAQALLYGFNFEQTLAWIAAGIAFDVTHGISNFVAGFLVLPLAKVIRKTLRIKA